MRPLGETCADVADIQCDLMGMEGSEGHLLAVSVARNIGECRCHLEQRPSLLLNANGGFEARKAVQPDSHRVEL